MLLHLVVECGSDLLVLLDDVNVINFMLTPEKGIFLGFLPNTTRNIEYYDKETHWVKSASNFRFNEGFNNLPLNELNPNVISLSRANDGEPLPIESDWCSSNDLHFINTPFEQTYTQTVVIKRPPIHSQKNYFGFVLCNDEFNKRVFISDIPRSYASTSIGWSKTGLIKDFNGIL